MRARHAATPTSPFLLLLCSPTLSVGGPRRDAPLVPQEPPQYPWMKKRDKAMPWTQAGGSKCDLFDYKCAAKEKAAAAAE